MKRRITTVLLLIGVLLMSGCWDRIELNDVALVYGWGIDRFGDGEIKISAQFAVPAKFGGQKNSEGTQGKNYFVLSGTGKNTEDAIQEMQLKLSRRTFEGFRQVIVIGEDLASHGLAGILDRYSRDPGMRLRTDMFVVRSGTAEDFLKQSYIIEDNSSIAALKAHKVIGGPEDNVLRDFLIAATSEGTSPTMPAVEISPISSSSKDGQHLEPNKLDFQFAGTAIFNKDLRLVGFLNAEEGRGLQWVVGNLKRQTFITEAADGQGNFSVSVINMDSKINPIKDGETMRFDITLTGEGTVIENNTKLDLSQPKNLALLNDFLNRETEKRLLETIKKVQTKYGTDVFEFGEAVHRKYPYPWKELKKNWETEFPVADVEVNAALDIKQNGLTGAATQLKEDEIKK